jgi:hypothetical protein
MKKIIAGLAIAGFLFALNGCSSGKSGMRVQSSNKMYKSW